MKKSLIWTILRRAVLVAAALIIGVNLYVWNASGLLGDQLPMPFGYGAAVVLTGSMGDALPIDSLIFVKEQNTCAEGQIVVFQTGRSLVVHRVVEVDGDTVITKGDANNTVDEPIAMSDIRGVVIGKIPGVGSLVRWLKTPVGILCVLLLAVGLIELSNRKERQDEDEELEKIRAEIHALKDTQSVEEEDKDSQ